MNQLVNESLENIRLKIEDKIEFSWWLEDILKEELENLQNKVTDSLISKEEINI